jgi:membrane protease subunit (stomatin/prohibitin family)
MSFFSSEFIDVIDWVDDSTDTIIWKFPREDNAIKMNAKLTVRESQEAIFMNEGVIADVYKPGMYTLTTQNMPVLTTLKSWKYGFTSPFKADVYFVAMHQFLNQRWGTKNPIIINDAQFGTLRLRAYGSFSYRINDAALFVKQISATNPDFTTDSINEQLQSIVVARGMNVVAASKYNATEMASHYDDISAAVTEKIKSDFTDMGLELTKFLLENVSLPEEVEGYLDKHSSMNILGNMDAYSQFQAANAIDDAANNPGGNIGAGLGVGMIGQMGNMFQQNRTQAPQETDAPPPIPGTVQYFLAINGKQEGPFTINDISKMVATAAITKDTLAWKKGMQNWLAVAAVPELSDLLGNAPPPLPAV